MKQNKITFLLTALLFLSFNVMAGDAEKGQALSGTCAACHGMDGNSVNPIWPSLAGQHEGYLARQIKLFKSGDRVNAMMAPMVAGLSDQDIEDLAAYFASQTNKLKAANPDLVELGQKIYQGGDKERNIPACMSCHGPTGQGNPVSGYPVVASQHAEYTAIQLRAYKEGRTVPNKDDVNGQVMADVAKYLTEEEIVAVSSYLQGLKSAQ